MLNFIVFRDVTNPIFFVLKSLRDELGQIRSQISLLHREISSKRCLSDGGAVSKLGTDCNEMKTNLDRVLHLVDEQNRVLVAIWDEDQRRIMCEQETFKKQVR